MNFIQSSNTSLTRAILFLVSRRFNSQSFDTECRHPRIDSVIWFRTDILIEIHPPQLICYLDVSISISGLHRMELGLILQVFVTVTDWRGDNAVAR